MGFGPPFLACAVLCLAPLAAQPERLFQLEPIQVQKKLALVIGNAAYRNASPLKNPVNDAAAMTAALRGLGVEVVEARDVTLPQLDRLVAEFATKLQRGDFGLFYFAGHGIQVQLENYLVPVEFDAADEIDAKYKAYAASRVRDKLEGSGARLRVMILDACRNNPFRGQRTGGGGLAPMQSGEGTLVAYATADNDVADDNPREANGLFTKHLVQALRTPGAHLKEIFESAREAVFAASGRRQRPYVYDGVFGRYYFTAPAAAAAPSPALDPMAFELAYWNSVKDSLNAKMFESYVQRYPRGQFVEIARERIAELTPAPPAAAVNPPAVSSSPPPEPHIDPTGGPQPGTVRRNPRDGLNYVWIPPGRFQMGCSPGDNECGGNEKPAHPVTISRGFWMGQTEVTAGAYKKSGATDNLPVVGVSWQMAKTFCESTGGRLPTEAEWEYAARAGSPAARYGTLDEIAWYSSNSGDRIHLVGTKQANAWGLYDTLGNVWEWTWDWYDEKYYSAGAAFDPQGPSTGSGRVVRGGSWGSYPRSARASSRVRLLPEDRSGSVGFRCVREGIP